MPEPTPRLEIVASPFYAYFVSGAWGGIFMLVAGVIPDLLAGPHGPGTGLAPVGAQMGLAYAVGMCILGMARLQGACLPPSALPDDGRGRVRLEDPGDGVSGFLDELARSSAFLCCGAVALVTGMGFLAYGSGTSDQVVLAGVAFAAALVCLGLGWAFLSKPYRAMRAAGPGRFAFTAWPIPVGTPVQVHYSRRLSDKGKLIRCEATLERVWIGRWHLHHRHVRVLDSFPLGDGGARRLRRHLAADWRFELPDAADDPAQDPLGAMGHTGWRLRVSLEVQGLPDDRSELYLAVRA